MAKALSETATSRVRKSAELFDAHFRLDDDLFLLKILGVVNFVSLVPF